MKSTNMKESKLKVGDSVIYTGSTTGPLKNGQTTKITFIGTHNGATKIMTPELDKLYPSKEGWAYEYQFEKVEVDSYEIF